MMGGMISASYTTSLEATPVRAGKAVAKKKAVKSKPKAKRKPSNARKKK
jgi:hypothetical protein